MTANEPTRDELIAICERGIVAQTDWGNRDHEYIGYDGDDHRDEELFYLPTAKRLDAVAGKDWY